METNQVLTQSKYCFLCQNPIDQSELILQHFAEQSIFNFLCDLLFNISTSGETGIDRFGLLKNSTPQNTDFCVLCNSEIRNILNTLEIIKSLQDQVNNFKDKVEKIIKFQYSSNSSSSAAQNFSQNEEEKCVQIAGKILAQCLSQPKVILEPLVQEQIDLYRSKRTEKINEPPRKIRRVKKYPKFKKNCCEETEIFKVELNPSELIQEEDDDDEEQQFHPNSTASIHSHNSDSDDDDAVNDPTEPEINSDDPSKPKKSSKVRKNPLEYEASCMKCGQVFKSKRKLHQHLLQVHDHDVRNFCRFCDVDLRSCLVHTQKSDTQAKDSTEAQQQQQQPQADPSGQTYICHLDNCQQRKFKTLTELWDHHRKRCIANPTIAAQFATDHPCQFCDMKFKQPISLRYHVANVHEKNFKFACEHCGKGFQIQYALQAHIDTVHVTVGKFQCEICSERFKQSKQLKEHLVKHTGEKPFVCEICGKGFHRRELMKKHTDNMHPTSQVPCGLCGKLFKSKHYVRNHMNNAHRRGYSLNLDGAMIENGTEPNNNLPEVTDTVAAIPNTTTTAAVPESAADNFVENLLNNEPCNKKCKLVRICLPTV